VFRRSLLIEGEIFHHGRPINYTNLEVVGSGPLFGLLPNGMDVTSNPLLLERQTTAPRIGRGSVNTNCALAPCSSPIGALIASLAAQKAMVSQDP
jgi:hypothetical protein